MDSSLIFLVVIGLWLAYLVPSWVRRREHLSASRFNDRFSTAMRVLDRREDVPDRSDRPAAPSYLLTPPRPPLAIENDEPLVEVAADRGRARFPLVAAVAATLLVVSLVAVPGTVALAALALAPAWAPVAACAAAAGVLVGLRARARRRARTLRRQGSSAVLDPSSVVLANGSLLGRADVDGEGADAAPVAAVEPAGAASRESLPGEWTPVPVPLPAYLLKDEVPRPRERVELDQVTRWYADWRDTSVEPVEPVEPVGHVRPEVDEDDIPTYAPPAHRRAVGA